MSYIYVGLVNDISVAIQAKDSMHTSRNVLLRDITFGVQIYQMKGFTIIQDEISRATLTA